MRVALYARVSTSDKNQDPELQMRPLREYASRQAWEVTEYVDHARAADFKGRKAWARLQRAAAAGEVDLVAVWKLDRPFRSALHALRTLEEWDQHRVALRIHTQELDTRTAAGRLVFTILAGVAEMESSLISERVREGMALAKSQGKQLGRPPRQWTPEQSRHWPTVKAALDGGHLTRREAARRLGVRYQTLLQHLGPAAGSDT